MLSDTSPPAGGPTSDSSLEAPLSFPMPTRVLGVLGMHRSGTSCLTGSLQEAGLALGDCHTWNPHNLKGNRENQSFVNLNDEVLAANNGAWDRPPQRVAWSTRHQQAAIELLGAHAGESVFGFKDPRTLLVLEGWKQIVPGMEFVGIFRHPMAVATSLQNRNGMALEQGLALWGRYNKLLLREHQRGAFPLLCFDEPEELLQEKMVQAARELNLKPLSDGLAFYSGELRSSSGEGLEGLPWKIGRVYRALCGRSK